MHAEAIDCSGVMPKWVGRVTVPAGISKLYQLLNKWQVGTGVCYIGAQLCKCAKHKKIRQCKNTTIETPCNQQAEEIECGL
jgi:hypothetical protein